MTAFLTFLYYFSLKSTLLSPYFNFPIKNEPQEAEIAKRAGGKKSQGGSLAAKCQDFKKVCSLRKNCEPGSPFLGSQVLSRLTNRFPRANSGGLHAKRALPDFCGVQELCWGVVGGGEDGDARIQKPQIPAEIQIGPIKVQKRGLGATEGAIFGDRQPHEGKSVQNSAGLGKSGVFLEAGRRLLPLRHGGDQDAN